MGLGTTNRYLPKLAVKWCQFSRLLCGGDKSAALLVGGLSAESAGLVRVDRLPYGRDYGSGTTGLLNWPSSWPTFIRPHLFVLHGTYPLSLSLVHTELRTTRSVRLKPRHIHRVLYCMICYTLCYTYYCYFRAECVQAYAAPTLASSYLEEQYDSSSHGQYNYQALALLKHAPGTMCPRQTRVIGLVQSRGYMEDRSYLTHMYFRRAVQFESGFIKCRARFNINCELTWPNPWCLFLTSSHHVPREVNRIAQWHTFNSVIPK